MVSIEKLDALRQELSIKAKNGVDFVLAASIVWLLMAFIWALELDAYNKAVLTFMAGGLMLPLAFLFSKMLKTIWTNKDNPLQPLGLWLNFAQLFYFPFLIFVMIRMPESFVMVYAIITGAHFFPYAWFYKTTLYAVFAGLLSVGSMIMGLMLPAESMFLIPVFMNVALMLLGILLYIDSYRKRRGGELERGRLGEISGLAD